MRSSALISLVMGIVAGHAGVADTLGESSEICSDSEVQTICQTTCAPYCGDRVFLEANLDYCSDNGFISFSPTPDADDDSCSAIFAHDTTDSDGSGELVVNSGGDDACAEFETHSERRRCELKQLTPACSPTVVDLEGRARLLVTEIGLELSQYGELLERDWTDINNRDALCTFSIAQLDDRYNLASENPALLRALQRQATEIQACQSEWEAWLRDNAGTQISDILIDILTRDAEAQLGQLRERTESLSESVTKLETATDTIGEIIDVHILFCDPDGSGAQTDN